MNTDIDETSEEQDFLSAEENQPKDSEVSTAVEEKQSVVGTEEETGKVEKSEKSETEVAVEPAEADPVPEVPVAAPEVVEEAPKKVENEPKAPEAKENSTTPKKKRKEKKPKSEGKAPAKTVAPEEKEPKKQSWASIAKSTPPPQPAAPPAVAAPKKAPVEEPKQEQSKPTQNVSPADARYLEVCDFNSSAKLDTLKNAFRIFGAVTYVHFLGHTRALVEFQDPKVVTKILALKEVGLSVCLFVVLVY